MAVTLRGLVLVEVSQPICEKHHVCNPRHSAWQHRRQTSVRCSVPTHHLEIPRLSIRIPFCYAMAMDVHGLWAGFLLCNREFEVESKGFIN